MLHDFATWLGTVPLFWKAVGATVLLGSFWSFCAKQRALWLQAKAMG